MPTTTAHRAHTEMVVIGGTVETARRVSMSAWNGFVDSFFLTAHFSEDDYPYDWLMHWLSKVREPTRLGSQPRIRDYDAQCEPHGMSEPTTGDVEEDDECGDDNDLVHGSRKRKVAFMPSARAATGSGNNAYTALPDYGHGAALKVSVVARNNDILKKLVLEAKREYEKDAEHRSISSWPTPADDIYRPGAGVKEMLLADCKDFLCSEEWDPLGIPFRRGYLLHGVPGSGKTSLIHSLAGELGLDIYVVSLSSKGMSDNTLTTLMGHVPSSATPPAESDGSTLSLSGLLNSLDGVAAAEGRLLFATTNHIERLDPALSRPGRMDVWVNFTHATKWQAEGIFKCFFPHSAKAPPAEEADAAKDASQKNLPVPKRKAFKHAVPILSEAEIVELAKRFAAAIPEDELSVAGLQGYLLKNKTRPANASTRSPSGSSPSAKLAKSSRRRKPRSLSAASREAKEKKEAEEREKKEKEEKEAKEKEERETKEKLERKEKAKKAAAAAKKLGETSAAEQTSTASSSESATESSSGADADTESVASEEETDDTPRRRNGLRSSLSPYRQRQRNRRLKQSATSSRAKSPPVLKCM
ncbi:unnamed protein product [Mycena citricolor]|uniref:BCS1 N-terminal domain-containing protein n=1 Tax=Mycena citricolor TaxID=2018698 RepID=A0AAD2K1G5_9AGAR|nr:unnamed protein product [Mycena citricolor]